MPNPPPVKVTFSGVDKLTRTLNRIGGRFDKFGKRATALGKNLTTKLTLPILGIGIAATKMSLDFNEAMANIQTLIPGNIKRIRELKGGIQDLSIETGKTTKELAKGQFQVISAFGDTAESLDILRIAARSARGGVAGVADAANLGISFTKAYGDVTAEAFQKVQDLAFMTNKIGVTDFPQMAAALPPVAGKAGELGVKMEEIFAIMATGAGVIGNTSEVATSLRGVMTAMIKPTADMEIALAKLGFRGRTAGKDLIAKKGLVGAIQALEDITKKYDIPLSKIIGRTEALTLAQSLTGKLSEKFTGNLEKMGKASGSADEAFRQQTEGINKTGFQLTVFVRKVTVLAQKIGDKLAPILLDMANSLEPVLNWFKKLSPETLKFIIKIAGLVAILGPFLVILGTIAAAIGFLLSPVGLVIVAIAAWAAAITAIILVWDKVKEGWVLIIEGIKESIMEFIGWFIDKFDKIKNVASGIGGFFGFGKNEIGVKALGAAAAGGGIQATRQESITKGQADVNIKFQNMPAGTRVDTDNNGVNLNQDLGFARAQ